MPYEAHEELMLIRRLMVESQQVALDNGKYFIVWGALSVVGLLFTYGFITGMTELEPGWVWGVLMLVGWIFSLWAGWRDQARGRVSSVAGRLLAGIWIGCGIALTLLAVLGLMTAALPKESLGGILAAVIGAGLYATSFISGRGWLRWLALAWWVGSAAMLLWPGVHTPLVMAGMVVFFQLLPGLAIYARSRRGLVQGTS